MVAFKTPLDIANRALQHCGASRIDPLLGFTEDSRNASEISACYDKIRVAELEANVWTCAVRRSVLRAIDANTMLLAPSVWSQLTTYFINSIVADGNGDLWISNVPNNLANDPASSLTWEPYFGPVTASLFAATILYSAGEVVYTAAGNGTYRVYLSLQSGNSDVPATATAYDATVTYFKNQVVTYLSVAYMSLIDLNKANTPASAPALFNIATTYAIGNQVGGSDGAIYTSVTNGNVGNDPILDFSHVNWTNTGVLNPWTTVFVGGSGSDKWLQIGGLEFPSGVGLTTLGLVYPIGAGPSTQQASRNVFRLPAGYLREAPQGPKRTASWLGGPSGITYNDWNFENGYIVSSDAGPIPFRFIANLTDVGRMSPMFCEAFAARVGLAVCDTLTQSNSQVKIVAGVYKEWIDRARIRNAIEQGYEDPPDDDYVTVRY